MMNQEINPKTLSEKIESTNVGYHRYLEQKNSHSLFCFMEGKHDPDYYLGVVRSICGDDCITIICGNKSNVIDVYNTVFLNDHERYKLAFFIDRDFDEPINNPDFYETESYSIENNYCSLEAFKRILKFGFGISEDADYWADVINFYISQFDQFHHTVDLFNAFYSCLHHYEREKGIVFKLNLKENFPSDLADINVNRCIKTYTLQNLLNKYGIDTGVMTDEDVDKECARLWGLNPFVVFRGKYEIEMLYRVLNFLISDANSNPHSRVIKKKISMSLNGCSFMADLAQYADIPDSLRNYLRKWAKVA